MMKNSFAILLLYLLVPAMSMAQTFTNDEYGYTIEIDNSYQLTRNNDATYFSSKDNDDIVIIRNWPGLDDATARDYLQQGYQDGRIAIVSMGGVEELVVDNGKGLKVDTRSIVERKLMRGMAASFVGNNGQGMVMLVSGSNEDWARLLPVAKGIIASVKFIDISAGPEALDWYYMLAGTRLSLRGSPDDTRRREDIYFCSDGSFNHRMSKTASNELDSMTTFGFSARTRSGSWKVIEDAGKNRLLLNYSDGREESAIIEDRSGQTFLDGQRFYMMRNNRCR